MRTIWLKKFRSRLKNFVVEKGVEVRMAAEAAVIAGPSWAIALLGVILILVALALIFGLKNFLVNSVLGLAALIIINYFGATSGVNVPINLLTVLITGILGLAGAGLILLLYFLGIKIY